MGRVFSYVDAVGSSVPTRSDFLVAAEVFDINCLMAAHTGQIVGSVLFGSAATCQATPRSDFDCLLVTDGSVYGYNAVRRIVMETLSAVTSDFEISPIPYSRDTLASGRHEIDRFFGHHLTGPDRVVQGEDVASFITFGEDNALRIFNNYARNKKRRLATTMVSLDETEELKGYQRLLELPLAIGRKLVKVVEETQGVHNSAVVHSANKQVVREASLKLFDELPFNNVPRTILDTDSEYSLLLEKTVAGHVDLSEYTAILDQMRELTPYAIHWLNALDEVLPEYLQSE